MPTSRPEIIPAVINAVMALQPRSILEIGIGFGKYGFLFREYLEVWPSSTEPERVRRENWRVSIDGIEIHAPYVGDVQRLVYNMIKIGDARELINDVPDRLYDLIFLGDMIEHMPKEDGHALLRKCRARAIKRVLVTTPNYFNAQGPEFGNEHERHHCAWTPDDFVKIFPGKVEIVAGRYIVASLDPL